ncbi:tetraspanin-33-like isoform X2 [Artemia franciscana]|uniref:tetraspanin-33-like isoform X2 n=1 Tax=Artemia franciscana TaxID=6661 RepID=UPI0032DA2855
MPERHISYVNPCVKYVMFAFNFLFWVLSGAIVGAGLYALADRWRTGGIFAKADLFQILIDIPVMMVIVGVVVFVVSTAGCVGALRENTCLLKLYSGCLLIFLLAELGLAICALIYPHIIIGVVDKQLTDAVIKDYREKPDLQNLIDFTQIEFGCCGLTERYGYHDWSKNEYFMCNESNPSVERCAVPYSCCKTNGLDLESTFVNVMCGYNVQKMSDSEARKRIYTTGCIPAITTWATMNLNIIGGVAIGAAVLQAGVCIGIPKATRSTN